MITDAKNKMAKPRKKKAEEQELPEMPKELKEILKPFSTAATIDEVKAVPKCSCAACHATVILAQAYRCRNCGVYGCDQCGFDPKAKICPKCGARR